jgi:serine/threonine-protein kinase
MDSNATIRTGRESLPSHKSGDEAFSLYLEARSEWNRRTPSAIRKAIRYLEKAISLNGSFALACAALADCYSILLDYGILSPREGLMRARLAAGRALHKGPNLAEALTAAAMVRQMDLDWSAAEQEFQAAIRAHPGYAVARQRYGLFLAWMGRGEEARREIAAARTLDPHAPAISASAAWIDYYQGKIPEAIRSAEKTLGRHPGLSSAQAVLALALLRDGRGSEAAEILADTLSGEQENVSLLSLLAYASARDGDGEEASRLIEKLRDWAETRYVSPYYLAVAHLGSGDRGSAMAALEDAERERSPQLVYLAADPIFDSLLEEEEFRALLGRLRLPTRGGQPARAGAREGVA